jgi:Ca2+-binding EF-hand superfamily protein
MLAAGSAFSQQPQTEGRQGRHHDPNRLFQRADADRDGKISADEWKRKPGAFSRLDQNHDGFITQDEAQSAALQHKERRGRRGQKLFGRMDTDNDTRISRDEWKGAADMFDRLDSNRDGAITRDELSQGRHRGKRRDGDSTGNTRPPS